MSILYECCVNKRARVFVTLTVVKFCLSKKELINTTIIIDDFKFRKDYHVLKKIFKINLVGRFGVIKLNGKTKILNNKLSDCMKVAILDYI